jgi:hypothetical protein
MIAYGYIFTANLKMVEKKGKKNILIFLVHSASQEGASTNLLLMDFWSSG